MLDIRRLRTDLDDVVTALARRGDPSLESELRKAAALDERMRAIVAERDETRSKVNALSKQVGALRREGNREDAEQLQQQSRELGEREKTLAAEHDDQSAQLRDTLLGIPNIPDT